MKTRTFLFGIFITTFFATANAQFNPIGTDILHTNRKVGIGNTAPGFKLDVFDNSGNDVVAKFETDEGFIAVAAAGSSTINPTYGNYIASHFTDVFTYRDLGLKTAPGVPQFMLKTNGNVGIGNNAPGFKLDVFDNSGNDVVAKFETDEGFIAVAAAGSSTINPTYGNYIASHFTDVFTYRDLGLKTAPGVPQLILKTNGNVGIGTVNPGAFRLAVNGKIRAKEIKVEAGWSDFVFEDDYYLRPLTDVEAFIQTHKHLPDIPSAQEVEENGVNLGEMESKLLQKIEELTLYIIEQEKRIKQLEGKNK